MTARTAPTEPGPHPMAATYALIAQAPDAGKPPEAKPGDSGGGLLGGPGGMFLMIGLFALFYIIVLLPQQRKQRKQQQEMLTNLKPGAKVVLSSGLVGTVVKVHEPEGEITLRSDDAKVRVLKSTVVTVRGEETTEAKS
jgi:preprotein translocase subunit YajC